MKVNGQYKLPKPLCRPTSRLALVNSAIWANLSLLRNAFPSSTMQAPIESFGQRGYAGQLIASTEGFGQRSYAS